MDIVEWDAMVELTSERFQRLVIEFCAGCRAGAGQASVAVVQAGSIVTTLLQHRQEGHVKKGNSHTLTGDCS